MDYAKARLLKPIKLCKTAQSHPVSRAAFFIPIALKWHIIGTKSKKWA
jgi:hypothetical protein